MSDKKVLFDLDAARDFLDVKGITLRLNRISREIEISGLPDEIKEDKLNNFFVWAYDDLRHFYSVSRQHSDDLFRLIATENSFNPVSELLYDVAPDTGKDYEAELFEILGLPESDELSRTLLHKAFLQSMALLYNPADNPQGADGIPVLCGPQGIGKSTLVCKLGLSPQLCRLGLNLNFDDKDTVYRAITCFVGEIAEIESTMKQDCERLKAFITNPIDEIRLPYARYSTKIPRRTSLFGTCNSDDFLCDPTGLRRFWVIPLRKIDLELLQKFDALKFWKQVEMKYSDELIKGRGDVCFRLTPEERERLAERNANYQKPIAAQTEVADILHSTLGAKEYRWTYTTVTEFKTCFEVLKPYSSQKIGKALDVLGVPLERRRINGLVQRVRLLPLPVFVASHWQSEAVNDVNEA